MYPSEYVMDAWHWATFSVLGAAIFTEAVGGYFPFKSNITGDLDRLSEEDETYDPPSYHWWMWFWLSGPVGVTHDDRPTYAWRFRRVSSTGAVLARNIIRVLVALFFLIQFAFGESSLQRM